MCAPFGFAGAVAVPRSNRSKRFSRGPLHHAMPFVSSAPVRTTAHATSDPPSERLQTSSGVDLRDLLIFLFVVFFEDLFTSHSGAFCLFRRRFRVMFMLHWFTLLARMARRATKSEIACRALTHATSACRALRYESAVIRSLQDRRHRDVLLFSITQLHESVVVSSPHDVFLILCVLLVVRLCWLCVAPESVCCLATSSIARLIRVCSTFVAFLCACSDCVPLDVHYSRCAWWCLLLWFVAVFFCLCRGRCCGC